MFGAQLARVDPVVECVAFVTHTLRRFGKVYEWIAALRLGEEFVELADEFEFSPGQRLQQNPLAPVNEEAIGLD